MTPFSFRIASAIFISFSTPMRNPVTTSRTSRAAGNPCPLASPTATLKTFSSNIEKSKQIAAHDLRRLRACGSVVSGDERRAVRQETLLYDRSLLYVIFHRVDM